MIQNLKMRKDLLLFEVVQVSDVDISARIEPNPCVKLYGYYSDETKKCLYCKYLFIAGENWNCSKIYKCRLRINTGTAMSDHRLKWSACGKFKEYE
jgi:hypothetical protein